MQTLGMTRFAGCAMVPVAARAGAGGADGSFQSLGIEELKQVLVAAVPAQQRQVQVGFI